MTLSGDGIVTLGAQTLTLTDASTTFSGAIDGTGGLTLTAGTETLSGDNLYSGLTEISSGATLRWRALALSRIPAVSMTTAHSKYRTRFGALRL